MFEQETCESAKASVLIAILWGADPKNIYSTDLATNQLSSPETCSACDHVLVNVAPKSPQDNTQSPNVHLLF